ncbi:hypothetical protein [Pseudotabrizicola sediminis]|uniref:hypothetical protein n=1 Tax=Pseudotabrizicola sediminis TaxID=2486418 RepID=UPI0010801921|nr:hypothetical protein [Pseudotabrizicola sediminis]
MYTLKHISPTFSGKLFAVASCSTAVFVVILLRILAGSLAVVSQNPVESLILGGAFSAALAVVAPTFFFTGYVLGTCVAFCHNFLATSVNLVKVEEGSFKFK